MLDIDQLQAGGMSFREERVDLSSAVEAAIAESAPLFEQADIHVKTRLHPGTFVTADPDRLSQVMTNLLSNAAKFSPMSSLVEVSLEEVEDTARIAVRDHGAGISPSFRARVFEKFAQADRRPGPHAGSGLGLSIAKQFVEQMGGEIGFETPRDGGTRFFVSLPIADRHADAGLGIEVATRDLKTDSLR